jgi:hypothetical protein
MGHAAELPVAACLHLELAFEAYFSQRSCLLGGCYRVEGAPCQLAEEDSDREMADGNSAVLEVPIRQT